MEFRWGILGTGFAARKFVLGLRQSAAGKAVLVASRSRSNAQKFADAFAIPKVAEGYGDCASASDVDAFYIATPPTLHREHALICIHSNKPVLIEKPLASTVEDAKAIIKAAQDHNVFCMEGMWTRFLPLITHLKKLIDDGRLGSIRSLSGSFGKANIPDKNQSIFDRDLGGGALLHRGIYPMSLAYYLLGPVDEVVGTTYIGETGVDEDTSILLKHTNGSLSHLSASLRTQLANDLTIAGTHGNIHVPAPIFRPYKFTLRETKPTHNQSGGQSAFEALKESTLLQSAQQKADFAFDWIRRSKAKTVRKLYGGNGYYYEADEVMRCVRAGMNESPTMPLSDSLEILMAMEKVFRATSF